MQHETTLIGFELRVDDLALTLTKGKLLIKKTRGSPLRKISFYWVKSTDYVSYRDIRFRTDEGSETPITSQYIFSQIKGILSQYEPEEQIRSSLYCCCILYGCVCIVSETKVDKPRYKTVLVKQFACLHILLAKTEKQKKAIDSHHSYLNIT